MGLGVEMVLSIFLLRGDFLVERMLYHCACIWHFNVDSEIGVYLVTWFTVNSGQDLRKPFIIALHQVGILERIRGHGKNQCGLEFTRHL